MSEKRNSYLVSKALKNFLFASVLASLAQRLATMTDAIVVSNLIGPDAISAINVVTPIITLFPTISILFGIGGSVLAAKAIGRHDEQEANGVFTTALIAALFTGILLSVVLFCLTPQIVSLVCPHDSRFFDMAVSFMHIMSLSAVPMILGFTLQSFVKTDGNPRLVMITVLSSTVLNVVLDIVFIRYCGMGIAGSAWGTILCFLFSLTVCLLHFRSPHSSFHLQFVRKKISSYVTRCITEGFPMSINTLMMGLCVYAFNSIVIHSAGADGMYVWSVCLQLLMLIQLMVAGVSSSIYSIGGMMIGEQDMTGLTLLMRRVFTYVTVAMTTLILLMEVWPEAFGNLFGGSTSGVSQLLHTALRIFALVLLPYALVTLLNALYQILGYRTVSIVVSITQLAVMVLVVGLFAYISPSLLWWGYPASALVLAVLLLAYTAVIHHRRPEVAPLTLIPQATEGRALNISIRLTDNDVVDALSRISRFLHEGHLSSPTAYHVRLCCEELFYNILRYAVRRHPQKHYIDLHIRQNDTTVTLLLKDDGRPFNPIRSGETDATGEHIGLRLVNATSQTLSYQYMYGQNRVYMTFNG